MACITEPSPSAARRKALREADSQNVIKVIDTYPIEKYYAVTDRLLQAFHQSLDARRLDDAYVYGIRFATFSIESLPKHKLYKHPSQGSLRVKNARQVDQVLKNLERVTERMDAEELVALQHQRQDQQDEHSQNDAAKANASNMMEKESRNDLEQSAMNKLKALQMKSDRESATKQMRVLRVFRSKKQDLGAPSIGTNFKQANPVAPAANSIEEQARILDEERKRLRVEAERLAHQQHEEETLAQERKRLRDEAELLAQRKREEEAIARAQELKRLKEDAQRIAREKEKKDLLQAQKRLNEEAERLALHQRQQASTDDQNVMNVMVIEVAAAVQEQRIENSKEEIELKLLANDVTDETAAQQETRIRQAELNSDEATANQFGHTDSSRFTLSSTPSQSTQTLDTSAYLTSNMVTLPPRQPQEEAPYKLPPMTKEEEQTIEVLRATISKQEVRLAALEEGHEKKLLLREAKARLDGGDRKGALHCLAQKKKLESRIDALKGAIFTMETQIILLESAVENRHVSRAIQAATEAMKSLQVDVDNVDVEEMNHAMEDFAHALANGEMFDEDELLSELQDSSNIDVTEQPNLLSLPTVPKKGVSMAQSLAAKPVQKEVIMASWF